MNNIDINNLKKTNKKGFTLIEMLVVISLIGILAALATVSFSSSQKQARDAARKSDLRQYQNAIEAYGNLTSGLYPSRTSSVSAYSSLCSDLNSKIEPDISCSQDPKNASDSSYDYKYISNGTGSGTASATSYVIWGKLENTSTTTYWIICSTGKIGSGTTTPSSSSCPI